MDAQALKEKFQTLVKENLKFDDREFVNPWQADKASVLLDAREFSKTPIDAEKCCKILTTMLYLLNQGITLTPGEVTDFFFGVTKLFQSQHRRLRRMVYLVIKSLEISETEVFIVTSCLTKDMNSKNDAYRANSIRVLARILDPSMAQQIDRYLKSAIVDKNAFVASSALVCGAVLVDSVPEVVRRWVNEIQEGSQSKHAMVQFHALALMYEVKKNDRLALHKVVAGLTRSPPASAMGECLLVRYATNVLLSDRDQQIERVLMGYLDSCLRTKSEMITFEAARAFCRLAAADASSDSLSVFGFDFVHAMTVLQIFLTSPKPVIRFGAIRTLNELAQTRPLAVSRCNADMEPLLTDSNRHIATLALTTLLKTGHEANVERLVKKITGFMAEISDVFKIEVVKAVQSLCLQYPSKHVTLLQFLASNLREDGAHDFKRDLSEAIISIVEQIPAAKEPGLLYLAEFIEDCEYHSLCARILGFIGEQAGQTKHPSKFIRFVYNRLILENAPVRAAAVSALAKIAQSTKDLLPDVLTLLEASANDSDDEVRDRIAHYMARLSATQPLAPELPFSVEAMTEMLERHMQAQPDVLFDVTNCPTDADYNAAKQKAAAAAAPAKGPGAKPAAGGAAPPSPSKGPRAPVQNRGPEIKKVAAQICPGVDLGELFHSGAPQPLTESEAEYTVSVQKHMFPGHVVLEFIVANTVPGVTLENINVQLGNCAKWKQLGSTQLNQLLPEQSQSAHCVLEKQDLSDLGALCGRFSVSLNFLVKEDGDDLGYDDDYPVEHMTITVADYVVPKLLPAGHFKQAWEMLSGEHTQKYALPYKSLEAALAGLQTSLNMTACEKTGTAEQGVRGHTLLLSGTFVGGQQVVAKCLTAFDKDRGTLLRMAVRSKDAAVAEVICKTLE